MRVIFPLIHLSCVWPCHRNFCPALATPSGRRSFADTEVVDHLRQALYHMKQCAGNPLPVQWEAKRRRVISLAEALSSTPPGRDKSAQTESKMIDEAEVYELVAEMGAKNQAMVSTQAQKYHREVDQLMAQKAVEHESRLATKDLEIAQLRRAVGDLTALLRSEQLPKTTQKTHNADLLTARRMAALQAHVPS
eukprot:Skav220113  [mRNA]  locus=scaffold1727:170993:171571:+ [translate_table: standard]